MKESSDDTTEFFSGVLETDLEVVELKLGEGGSKVDLVVNV